MKRENGPLLIVLTALSAGLILVALYLALVGAPDVVARSETFRVSYRIIYFHVSTAWVGFLAFFVTFLASVVYLRRQARKWDIVALASAEIGTVFMLGVLVSGSIWAKPSWNVWWIWDVRLTISLIQFLVYVGYLMLRSSVDDPARRARFGAVYGVIAFVAVPINFLAIRLWRSNHPLMFGTNADQGGLGPNMMFTFFFCLIAFTIWYVTLMWHRIRLEQLHDDVEELKQRAS